MGKHVPLWHSCGTFSQGQVIEAGCKKIQIQKYLFPFKATGPLQAEFLN